MKTVLAQIKLKTGDFDFNCNQIIKIAENTECDLLVFPSIEIEELGGKDLAYDEKCRKAQEEFYFSIAKRKFNKSILLGDILVEEGEVCSTEDGFYEICGQKVYVDEIYRDDVICDLYVLAKNRYFVMDSYNEFIENIAVVNNLIYINALCMADESVYAGGSFAKNKNNEIVLRLPVCEEKIEVIDFGKNKDYNEPPLEELVFKVLTFGLREYCENTRLKKVILGLSGGIDSALTAVLAVQAIGPENVLGILMPSMFSSQGSITDSILLAENLGVKTEKHSITPLFDNFINTISFEAKNDLAEENLQARLRGMILMFFSNRDNRLLLSTSNKSEMAMGFGTLYGDMAGGLNLICDLTKTNVYKLSNYINRDFEIIPQSTIDKAPSAELRPNQKDQDRLPEYAVLDDIIEMYVEKNCCFDEIYAKYDKVLVDDTIKKIYRAQFKRKQSCLGIRLTERSFTNGVNLPVLQRFY